jgi:hypothetical protein
VQTVDGIGHDPLQDGDGPMGVDQGFIPVEPVTVRVCEETFYDKNNIYGEDTSDFLINVPVMLVPMEDGVPSTTQPENGGLTGVDKPGVVTFPIVGDYIVKVDPSTTICDSIPSDPGQDANQSLTVVDGQEPVVDQGFSFICTITLGVDLFLLLFVLCFLVPFIRCPTVTTVG